MQIQQFEDKQLSHYSYAILSENEIAIIDPSRDPQPYFEFAKTRAANIKMVIETHPHADFVSSHLELHKKTGATIYVSELLGADYPHDGLKDGEEIRLGRVSFECFHTPGHSPDSISLLLKDENKTPVAVFTGDTLFIGDCGRPDLRENAGSITAARRELAKQMYHSLREKLAVLPGSVIVYPAHGAGSLCGKGLSKANQSTIASENISNWSLQDQSEDEFIDALLEGQPFVPKYFEFDVSLNRKGAASFEESIAGIKPEDYREKEFVPLENIALIDTRPKELFHKGHLKRAINLLNNPRFETWLGSIVSPGEKFYLIAADEPTLKELIARAAKIGYESQIEGAIIGGNGTETSTEFNSDNLRSQSENYVIVDVRNENETAAKKIFANAINIPLHQLRERTNEIPKGKTIIVHCAGGTRSAAGSSIIRTAVGEETEVYDLGAAVKEFE